MSSNPVSYLWDSTIFIAASCASCVGRPNCCYSKISFLFLHSLARHNITQVLSFFAWIYIAGCRQHPAMYIQAKKLWLPHIVGDCWHKSGCHHRCVVSWLGYRLVFIQYYCQGNWPGTGREQDELNSSPLGQNGRHFTDDVLKCIFMNEMFCILIRISLKFVPKGLIDNNPALV